MEVQSTWCESINSPSFTALVAVLGAVIGAAGTLGISKDRRGLPVVWLFLLLLIMPAVGTAWTFRACQLPGKLDLNQGDEKSLEGSPVWVWVCSGDMSIRQSNGKEISYYDTSETTGLVMMFARNTRVLIVADNAGSCQAVYSHKQEDRFKSEISETLEWGCGGKPGCSTVFAERLKSDGTRLKGPEVHRKSTDSGHRIGTHYGNILTHKKINQAVVERGVRSGLNLGRRADGSGATLLSDGPDQSNSRTSVL